jgi:pimeloyl-ACP methyl ester carboxylesterase
MDLMSTISGSAQDFKLIMDYLPTYFPQFTRFHNIVFGISLGAHMAYRLASLAPDQIEAFAIVVGCPTIASLLLGRLGIDATALNTTPAELGNVSYDRLLDVMNDEQRRRWPRALAEQISEADRNVFEEFPTDLPLMLCNGKLDPLVPQFYTAEWLEKRRNYGVSVGQEDNVKFFVQENTGHSCTKEMIAMIAAWLGDMFEARSSSASSALTEARL